jgi:alcohol dehydrogenase class IV
MSRNEVSAWPNKVYFGEGCIEKLPSVLDAVGGGRAMVVCGSSVARGEMLASVKAALGTAFAGVFSSLSAHTPMEVVEQAADEAKRVGADTVISVGGGSAIDAGKGVVLFLSTEGAFKEYSIDFVARGMNRKKLGRAAVKHIAIPTTAGSGSDVMPTAGMRDSQLKKKMLFWDELLVPDATMLDPRMASHAPALLTAASGMTAVARSIEALYSKDRNPISTALALHSIRLMADSLPESARNPLNLKARSDCQLATVMASTASINAMASAVHAIGHVLGGRYGLQHGLAHAILLAPVLKMLMPAIGSDYRHVLHALGCAPADTSGIAAERASAALKDFLNSLPLPHCLRDVGIEKSDLRSVAEATMNEYMMGNLPKPMGVDDVESLLKECW